MIKSNIVIILLFSLICHSTANCEEIKNQVATDKRNNGCEINIKPKKFNLDRNYLLNLSNKSITIICPFSDGNEATILEANCNPREVSNLGIMKVNKKNATELKKEAQFCSPVLSIIDSRVGKTKNITSYLIYPSSGNIDPGHVSKIGVDMDWKLRQILNGVGAPIVYYNSLSNLICLSKRENESFDIKSIFKKYNYRLPDGYVIKTYKDNCTSVVQQKFGYKLSDPVGIPNR